jgi:hypothetical protein
MLSLFRRRPRLPADRRPPLERDERVVAWSAVSDSETVVATNRGLWLPDDPGTARLGWHEIHKAVWSGRQLAITAAAVVERRDEYAVVSDLPRRSYLLLAPGEVPHQVRARVTGSVAYTRHHPTPDGGGVRVVARRVSGRDGVTWTVRPDPGTDVDTPPAREAVDDLVAQSRAALPPG